MSRTHATAPAAPVRGPLTDVAPEAKLVGLVAFLAVVATTPPSRPWVLAGQAAVAVGVAAIAPVRSRAVVRRLVIDLPLVVLAITMAVAGSGPRTHVAGISLSQGGLRVGVALLGKATIGIVAVSAVAAATTASETVAGLRRLRLPGWICDLVALTARQLQVLGDELARLRLAGSIRAGTRGRRGEWSAVARSLGVLFVRGIERADRLEVALAARGGPPPAPHWATTNGPPPATATAAAPAAGPTARAASPTARTASPGARAMATATVRAATATGWPRALLPAVAAIVLRAA